MNGSPTDDRARGLYLNGATIMTTPTDAHLRIARDVGYAGIEARAERLLGPDGAAELRAAARLVEPGDVWSLNGIQIKIEPDGRLRGDLLSAELAPRLEVCRALAARYLLVVPPRIADVAAEIALPGVIDGLRAIRDGAVAAGVRVAFEFLGFGDCPIDSPSLAARVVAAADGADLVLDSCHWHASGGEDLERFAVERLAMVHLNDAPAKPPREIEDADRVLPTLGVIRLRELIAALRRRGFAGPWSLETFNPGYWTEDPEAIARHGFELTEPLIAAPVPS